MLGPRQFLIKRDENTTAGSMGRVGDHWHIEIPWSGPTDDIVYDAPSLPAAMAFIARGREGNGSSGRIMKPPLVMSNFDPDGAHAIPSLQAPRSAAPVSWPEGGSSAYHRT
jgi:hypothetical protein